MRDARCMMWMMMMDGSPEWVDGDGMDRWMMDICKTHKVTRGIYSTNSLRKFELRIFPQLTPPATTTTKKQRQETPPSSHAYIYR